MIVIIDRFEGSYAVCEKNDATMINIEKRLIPEEAKEGNVLIIQGEDITIDYDKTQKLKSDIKKLTEDLWE